MSKLYIVSVLIYSFNLKAEYMMRNVGLNEMQAEIKISRRNVSNLKCAIDTTLTAETEKLVCGSRNHS